MPVSDRDRWTPRDPVTSGSRALLVAIVLVIAWPLASNVAAAGPADAIREPRALAAGWTPGGGSRLIAATVGGCQAGSRAEAVRCAQQAYPGAEILSVAAGKQGYRVKLLSAAGVVRTVTVPRRG